MFTALVAPATATPDWCKGRYRLSEHSRALTTRVTESDIHHFVAQAKMTSISEDFFLQSVLILIGKSASCLGALVLKREQKETVSRSREDFPSCGSSSTPRCIFKRSAR